jgi:hypothetical protein
MKTTFYQMKATNRKLFTRLGTTVLAIHILILMGAGAPLRAEHIAVQDAIGETVKDIEALWPEAACESVLVKKKGHPLASIACTGNFDRAQRARFLDVLFKHSFALQTETYRLRPQNGMYLYKTVHQRRAVYFKLFLRNAQDLWPRNPVIGRQIAIYVQNLRTSTDLLTWRTLGVPLTFGVTLGRSDSAELASKLTQYGDEVWLAIPLEDDNIEVADGALLSISDALDSERLAEYLKDVDEDGIQGISPLYCSRFCKNVPALRALFTALREKNGERELTLIDADPHENSSFYETGRIMNFRTFRAYHTDVSKANFCNSLKSFAFSDKGNASRIMAVDAADTEAFQCLKEVMKKSNGAVDFVRVSQMSVTNPFR